MRIELFHNEEAWILGSYSWLLEVTTGAVNPRIGISGGSTPLPLYKKIAQENTICKQIEFALVDERFDVEEKNYNWFSIKKSVEGVCNMLHWDTSLDRVSANTAYEKQLGNKSMDACILGMGTDGHIASLFPGTGATKKDDRLIAVDAEENPFPKRVSMSLPYILQSRSILLLLRGKDKEEALHKLMEYQGDIDEFPASALKTHPNCMTFLLLENA